MVRDAQRYSGDLVYRQLETISFALFHTASTLSGSLRSPPSPRGEGFVSGIAVFSYRSLPHWGRGTAPAVDRVLSQTAYLRRSFPLVFHTASTLSGSLRSPPSPRGEGVVSRKAVSPSNLRPFGAPPSIGRRECPREPLPLEGAAERSEAGLASFFRAAKPPPLCLPPLGKGDRAAVDRVLSQAAHLRRSSSLFFIPLEPYPARSARHLPHAGKALCRG